MVRNGVEHNLNDNSDELLIAGLYSRQDTAVSTTSKLISKPASSMVRTVPEIGIPHMNDVMGRDEG